MKKLVALVFCLMVPFTTLAAELPVPQAPQAPASLLPRDVPQTSQPIVIAQAHAGEARGQAQEARQENRSHGWSTFWDVHFGGYRWMWWAAVGGALIAIHAN